MLLSAFTIYANNQKPTICIDPGHGGFDGGAKINETIEKDITLKASLIIGRMLEQTGYKVIYTRTTDTSLATEKVQDMKKRLKIINKETNLLYISIHANTYSSKLVKGAQTFYNQKNDLSKSLACFIQDNFQLEDKTNQRAAKAIKDKYLTDNATTPGCIVELGFMSNPSDLDILLSNEKLEYRCLMIYLGILKYLEYNN